MGREVGAARHTLDEGEPSWSTLLEARLQLHGVGQETLGAAEIRGRDGEAPFRCGDRNVVHQVGQARRAWFPVGEAVQPSNGLLNGLDAGHCVRHELAVVDTHEGQNCVQVCEIYIPVPLCSGGDGP